MGLCTTFKIASKLWHKPIKTFNVISIYSPGSFWRNETCIKGWVNEGWGAGGRGLHRKLWQIFQQQLTLKQIMEAACMHCPVNISIIMVTITLNTIRQFFSDDPKYSCIVECDNAVHVVEA